MIYFTSDWHLGHIKIIEYCKRPFQCVGDMDETLVHNFNSIVKPEDTTYFLGDFCFSKNPKLYMNLMNGYKVFLWGNHDKNQLFKSFPKSCVYEGYGVKIHMTHFPKEARIQGFDISVCGHVHEKWKTQGKLINVSVDVWDFKPVSIIQLIREVKRNA